MRQSNRGQAELLALIVRFKERHGDQALLHAARTSSSYSALLDRVELKLIEMPIPRLQYVGVEEERFLYEYNWTSEIRLSTVRAYQRGEPGALDNRLLLKSGVASTADRSPRSRTSPLATRTQNGHSGMHRPYPQTAQ